MRRVSRSVAVRSCGQGGGVAAECVHLPFELGAGDTFVGDDDLAFVEETVEQFGGNDPFGCVRWGELEADWQPVG